MDVIAMDAGQSGIRAQLRNGDRVMGEIECAGVLTDRPVVPQLAEVARQLRPANGTVLAAGCSGLGRQVSAADLLAATRPFGIKKALLAHDSITSYLGALGDQEGCVVAAGSGVVTLAVGTREVARVDGWGYLVGDAGSGFWIGRAGLDAVLRAHDGRGLETALTEHIRSDFPDLEEAYLQLQADEFRVSRIASYAQIVAELADQDEVCARICQKAARELAISVLTGLDRVGQSDRDDPAVSCVGKVFGSLVLTDNFTGLLTERFGSIRILRPNGNGLDGAALLAKLKPTSALWQQVSVADLASN